MKKEIHIHLDSLVKTINVSNEERKERVEEALCDALLRAVNMGEDCAETPEPAKPPEEPAEKKYVEKVKEVLSGLTFYDQTKILYLVKEDLTEKRNRRYPKLLTYFPGICID